MANKPKLSEEKILVAGAGGQGVMLLGKIIALAAMHEGMHVTFIPSYGSEVRGGTSYCLVKVSRTKIASPVFDKFTVLFALNSPSWDKFMPKAYSGALAIVNTSLCDIKKRAPFKVIKVPLNHLAQKLGSLRTINLIAVGAFVKHAKICKGSSVETVIKKYFSGNQNIINLNLQAFKQGLNYD